MSDWIEVVVAEKKLNSHIQKCILWFEHADAYQIRTNVKPLDLIDLVELNLIVERDFLNGVEHSDGALEEGLA